MSSNNRLKYKSQPDIERPKPKKNPHMYKNHNKYSSQNFSNSTKIIKSDSLKNPKSFQENHTNNTINTHHRNETVNDKSQKAMLKRYHRNNRSNRVKSNDIIYNHTLNDNFNDNINLSSANNDYYRSVLYPKINEDSEKKYKGIRNSAKINSNYTVSMNSRKNNRIMINKEVHTERQNSKNNLNDNFQAMEDMIIDKNYENNIANDEIIIGNKKTTKKHLNENNSNENSLSSSNENEENLFDNLKNDFNIMYIPNYEKMINDDMLSLEIQLLYEKIIELQFAYHSEFKRLYIKFKNKQKNYKNFISLNRHYKKKIINLHKINEMTEKNNKLKNTIFLENKKEKTNSLKLNNIEFDLWKQILGITGKYSLLDKNEIKKIVLDIFKNVIFERYQKIKNNMSELEKNVTLNMMKKYNYRPTSTSTGKNYNTNNNVNNTKHDKMNIYSKNRNMGKYKIAFTSTNNTSYHQENNRNSSSAHKKNGKNIYTKKKW